MLKDFSEKKHALLQDLLIATRKNYQSWIISKFYFYVAVNNLWLALEWCTHKLLHNFLMWSINKLVLSYAYKEMISTIEVRNSTWQCYTLDNVIRWLLPYHSFTCIMCFDVLKLNGYDVIKIWHHQTVMSSNWLFVSHTIFSLFLWQCNTCCWQTVSTSKVFSSSLILHLCCVLRQ